MSYVKYKEITKYFDFSKFIEVSDLPKYTLDYVYENEDLLLSYKTFRDYGLFTDTKIILFDNTISLKPFKKIYTIPYSSISSCYILFRPSKVQLQFDLENGYQLKLFFVNMDVEDKIRIRLLYSIICRIISNQKVPKELINSLSNSLVNIKEK